jgi:hypothetical protein
LRKNGTSGADGPFASSDPSNECGIAAIGVRHGGEAEHTTPLKLRSLYAELLFYAKTDGVIIMDDTLR